MRYDPSRLVETGAVSQEHFNRASQAANTRGESVPAMLSQLGLVDDRKLADALALAFDLPRFKDNALPEISEENTSAPIEFLTSARIWPLGLDDQDALQVAVVDPTDTFSLTMMHLHAGRPLSLNVITPNLIDQAARSLDPDEDVKGTDDQDIALLKDMASDAPIVRELDFYS